MMTSDTIFRAGGNCRTVAVAEYAAPLIDCANYYQALHESICRARHSIFVLGWDIDGRIRLLRNGERTNIRFFDLICWKAEQTPSLQVFLNRWDYSLFMARDREAFGSWRWRRKTPPNVHYCLDAALPTGACHHQKIIVIDDEIAFCGGMDIALNRWDRREHMPHNHKRIDPGPMDHQLHLFSPYHDAQIVVAGPVVQPLATITRERWVRGTGGDSIPFHPPLTEPDRLPASWPPSAKPVFRHVPVAVSETLPRWDNVPQTEQVKTLYIDMINRAEQFIYMENQFLAHQDIAHALNRRLCEKPALRLLIVSSYNPRGIMERKALWNGRVHFRDIIEANGVKDRVMLAYVISRVNGLEKQVRIHSKLMVVDDRYLRIGSSNINNRSMYVDTECDLVIEAQDEATSEQIRHLRNDLIREHCGREIADIDHIITSGAMPTEFLHDLPHSRQHLREVNDEPYRHDLFTKWAKRVADPCKPLIPVGISIMLHKGHVIRLLLVVIAIASLALAWKYTPLAAFATPERIVPMLEEVRNTPWAVPAAMAVYTIGTLLFFPHMAMTATIVLVFLPFQAFSIAMTGSLISGAIGFFIGHKLGLRSMRALVGNAAEKVSGYAKKGGLLGITLLRLLPIAPYTAVNLALGMLEVPFWIFMVGTFLGTLPGTTVAAFLGHSALEAWQNPSRENMLLLAAGLAVWIGIVVISHLAGRWWRKRYGGEGNLGKAQA